MKYTGFLCGGFSTLEGRKPGSSWEEIHFSDEQLRTYECFYLPEFVRFNLNPKAVEFGAMSRYEMKIGKTFDFGVEVNVPELKLYMMPFNMALFAIRVDIESDDINGITGALATLRNIGKLTSSVEFTSMVLAYLKDAYCLLTDTPADSFEYISLVENGNKFKIFQIALIDGDVVGDKDQLLFEMGCVAPINSYDGKSMYSASESYFNRLMSENKLSIYNNWSCLGLSDTLTILAEDCPEWLVRNWINDYFGLIYIWQLFRKNYILRLTKSFRFEKRDPEKLIKESFEFEKKCSFSTISYNFLPEEFKGCVEHGLQIEEDKEVLYHLLEQENDAREKASDSKMNYLLFFMTCLTMFSAIYDACCLYTELFPSGNNMASFRLLASTMCFVIMSALLANRLISKRMK